MSTTSEGIEAFVRFLTLGEDRRTANPRLRDLIPRAPNVVFDAHARELYSYGRHFPLARWIPARRGRNALWLVNGDRWARGWTTTPRQQDETRSAIARVIRDAAKVGRTIETLIVPFGALDGARIDRDSIRPVEVRADRNERFQNRTTVPAELLSRPLPSREELEESARREWEAKEWYSWQGKEKPSWDEVKGRTAIGPSQRIALSVTLTMERESLDSGATDHWTLTGELSRSVHYQWHGYENGQSKWFTRETPRVRYWFAGSHQLTIIDADAGTVSFTTDRHWLGDSLFTAEIPSRRFIPCPNHTIENAYGEPGNMRCNTCRHHLADPGTIERTVRRRYRFVSSFDYNEPWPLYFLAALPKSSRATTVTMAVDDLAPPAVHAAYARGLAVKRQGDIFFIPTPLTDEDVYARSVKRTRLYQFTQGGNPRKGEVGYARPLVPREEYRSTLSIFGTAHTATEVAVCKRGVTYARGIVCHVPAIEENGNRWRRPDHRNVRLDGARWYLAIRNTVPRQ